MKPLIRTVVMLTWVVLLWVPAAAANHTKVYVANQGSDTVTVIDDQRVSAMASAQADSSCPSRRLRPERTHRVWSSARTARGRTSPMHQPLRWSI